MGLSQQIGASSLSKPGVCTSTTRPATPYEGQMIYETDTDLVLVYNGTAFVEIASVLTKAPRGIMAYAQTTSSDLTITAEETQITGSSFTAVANRYYKITYYEPGFSGGTGYVASRIRKTNLTGTLLQQNYFGITADTDKNRTLVCQWVGTLTAGPQVVVATLQTNTGTGSAYRAVDSIAHLFVEDMGAV